MNKLILPTLIISLVATSTSWAKGGHYDKSEWAKVTRVEPITQRVRHHTPQETCWNEPVHRATHRDTKYRNNNHGFTGTIVGGIIGGVIGHQVGHNTGTKNVGTVLGAVVGASVGNGLSSRSHSTSRHQSSHRTERYCNVERRVNYREKVVGYDVWYRYHGNRYHTRMDNHPGKKIRVSVNVHSH